MDDAKWNGLFLFDRRVLKAIGFKLPGETYLQSGVGLGVGGGSWVGEAIQEWSLQLPPMPEKPTLY